MDKFYDINIAGLDRKLLRCPLNDKIDIGAFIMFGDVELTVIDETEQPDVADQWDYYYVPTYFVGKEKLHEGAATKDKIQRVFERALK